LGSELFTALPQGVPKFRKRFLERDTAASKCQGSGIRGDQPVGDVYLAERKFPVSARVNQAVAGQLEKIPAASMGAAALPDAAPFH
jgi:hypothetical protein